MRRFALISAVFLVLAVGCGFARAEGISSKDPDCIYFAHPLNTYNTELEKILVARISETFPGKRILNPNNPEADAGVKRYIKLHGNPMLYFLIEVLPFCTGGTVGLPMRDGMWTTGAYLELFEAFKMEYPIYAIDVEGKIVKLERLPAGALTIKESRERMRNSDGTYKPY